MSDTVISVEGLSKRYLLGHRSERRENYTVLRDVLARSTRNLIRKATDFARGRQIILGDEIEEFWALKDVSFDVQRGEVIGIVGRNGAGKSTLLKILSRITEPTTGRVRLRGRVASLLEVGTGFHPELTGRDNIILNGAILGMSQREVRKKFDEIVSFAEVEQFLDTPVKRYSSGMYVRLAFAVAAHLEPEVLVVDEVLSVGDHEFQKKCLGKLGEVSSHGRTILFVSHNMQAVRALCSRAVVLSHGQAIFDGASATAIDHYVKNTDRPTSNTWQRPPQSTISCIGFESVVVSIEGEQPHLRLQCRANLRCANPTPRSFLAVEIKDNVQTSIMQAIPVATPFIDGTPGIHRLSFEIDLPPLIPGTYYLDFWMGHHYTSTLDLITEAVSFEILTSPTPGRSFSHSSDHGWIVPSSRILSE